MSETKYLLYPAEGDVDEDDGLTQGEMAAMLVRLEHGYSLDALLEAVKALEDLVTRAIVTYGEDAHYTANARAALEKLR